MLRCSDAWMLRCLDAQMLGCWPELWRWCSDIAWSLILWGLRMFPWLWSDFAAFSLLGHQTCRTLRLHYISLVGHKSCRTQVLQDISLVGHRSCITRPVSLKATDAQTTACWLVPPESLLAAGKASSEKVMPWSLLAILSNCKLGNVAQDLRVSWSRKVAIAGCCCPV